MYIDSGEFYKKKFEGEYITYISVDFKGVFLNYKGMNSGVYDVFPHFCGCELQNCYIHVLDEKHANGCVFINCYFTKFIPQQKQEEENINKFLSCKFNNFRKPYRDNYKNCKFLVID